MAGRYDQTTTVTPAIDVTARDVVLLGQAIAPPLAVDGAIQLAERSLGRADRDLFTPSTSVSVLTRTQRSTLPGVIPLAEASYQGPSAQTAGAVLTPRPARRKNQLPVPPAPCRGARGRAQNPRHQAD